ncbi:MULTISPECIES: alpha-ketoglutaric semialdehyde dehydrogenase GucD [Bacillus]|uniref:alpha-ketoglutaric semialdehyde dehydrogenase GucD n=1 Tax=Bacillus TaxID=1386 RepID=UPI0015823110|nr:alpha-ketoglutaric semialdehyde dehydrogenase GucD [Bacillus glycinifermentans]MBU8785876.1 aldehyde dehydrogenase family protein [Bacillus glycinifermentans]NUJ15588.1 aldehyde dehydrogenase family protein [Bacillus glycinifermentans]
MPVTTEQKTYLNFINGEWVKAESGSVEKVVNPADTRDVVGFVQKSSSEDVDRAAAAANEAKTAWRKLSGAERGRFLYKAADIMERRLDEIAECATREMGKTLPEAKGETARGIAILKFYAGEGMRKTGDVIPSTDKDALMFTDRVPLGAVGVIAPWNFPVAIPIWKMAPALVYGNTVVIKPATETAVTCLKIVSCFEEAGFPAGVVNAVTGPGSEVGGRLAEHPGISGVTFTGSNQTGKSIGRIAFERGAKYQLEMGGKNPVIVANDADLDAAAEAAVSGAFRSTGQKCTATSRVIVQSGVYDRFKEKLIQRTKDITIGDSLKEDVWMGPIASKQQLDNCLSYIEKGKQEGAELIFGGERLTDGKYENGYYISPAIFDQVTQEMTIAREEIFGPVIALIKADTIEEAIKIANDVEYGLSASIFTENIGHMLSFINDMEAGLIRVNAESAGVELQAPFGGLKQSSSHSREQGEAAKEFFTAVKTVFIKR